MSNNIFDVAVIPITDDNKDGLVDLALEMARRDCCVCGQFNIPYGRCLYCAKDSCEGCTRIDTNDKCVCLTCWKQRYDQ